MIDKCHVDQVGDRLIDLKGIVGARRDTHTVPLATG
jgi:hypothetical protein